MGIAGRVVVERLALDRILRDGERELDRCLRGGGTGRRSCQTADRIGILSHDGPHADFQRRQRSPGVAITDVGEEIERVLMRVHRPAAEPALPVTESALEQQLDLCRRQRLEREDLAAAQERRVDREERILRRRADQDDAPFLHIRQQHVLLRAVEAVQLVHEQDRAPATRLQFRPRLRQQIADLLDADGDRVDLAKDATGVIRDHVRQGGLAGSRRAVEDDRAEPIRL